MSAHLQTCLLLTDYGNTFESLEESWRIMLHTHKQYERRLFKTHITSSAVILRNYVGFNTLVKILGTYKF